VTIVIDTGIGMVIDETAGGTVDMITAIPVVWHACRAAILVIRSEEPNRLKNRLRDGLLMWIRSVVTGICRAVAGLIDVQISRFRRGEQALLNVLPEFRWTIISGS
jgi:hypothetical protein